jgi:hypothetical protein
MPDETHLHLTQTQLHIYESVRYTPDSTRRVMTASSTLSTILHSYGNSTQFAAQGKKVFTKRIPAQPRESHTVDVSKTSVEFMTPFKHRDLF